jgi:capsular polysaccharide biosynthesis protein
MNWSIQLEERDINCGNADMTPDFQVVADDSFSTYRPIHAPFLRRTSSFSRVWSGLAGGAFTPEWWNSDLEMRGNRYGHHEAQEIWYLPEMGVIISSGLQISALSASQASYTDPKFNNVRNIWHLAEGCEVIDSASIILPWGAVNNYGHFILDGLTAAPDLDMPIVTPVLKDWQRQHLDTIGVQATELPNKIYKIKRAQYATPFGQNMHNPNLHFLRLKQLQCDRITHSDRKIYVSRGGQKRQFASEQRLMEELGRAGFEIVQPESLSVREQIALFQSAKIIVAPTGAALANCLYCQPKTRVVELIPRDMTRNPNSHKWVAYLAALTGGDWRPYFCENLEPLDAMPDIGGTKRPGFLAFDADIADLVKFIMKAVDDPIQSS